MEQCINRLSEKLEQITEAMSWDENEPNDPPLLLNKFKRRGAPNCTYYKQIKWRGMHLRVDRVGDSFCSVRGDRPVKIKEIFQDYSDKIYVSGNLII